MGVIMSEIGKLWEKDFEKKRNPFKVESLEDIRRMIEEVEKWDFFHKMIEYGKLQKASLILEVGCGTGKACFAFARWGYHAVALDYSKVVVENLLRERELARDLISTGELEVVQGDAEQLQYGDNIFDLVFNAGVIEHWLNRDERLHVIREMVRVTKRQGTVAIQVPKKHFMDTWWYFTKYPGFDVAQRNYLPQELIDEMKEAGLVDIELYPFTRRPWQFINRWPSFFLLRYIGGLLNRVVPLSKKMILALNTDMFAVGRKP